jgi:hypothetical protein
LIRWSHNRNHCNQKMFRRLNTENLIALEGGYLLALPAGRGCSIVAEVETLPNPVDI